MLINLHILQNYAPSNLNRDDTGSPKDAVFGGVLRARISSQSIKRSIRQSEHFRSIFSDNPQLLAMRSQLFPDELKKKLVNLHLSEDDAQVIAKKISQIGKSEDRGSSSDSATGQGAATSKKNEKKNELATKQLIFFTEGELDSMAKHLKTVYKDKASFEKIKIEDLEKELKPYGLPRSADISMFGRMTTSAAFTDVEAAVQVAHAISTHRIEQEFDYYTAVDDLSKEVGAGFIGDTSFNSATYYKYFNIHWEELLKNLGHDEDVARNDVYGLILGACRAHPTGKQNSFAAFNPPDFVLLEVRDNNVPVSYANAFLKPVRAKRDESLVEASVNALADYRARINKMHNLDASTNSAYASTQDADLSDVKKREEKREEKCESIDDLLSWLEPFLKK